MKCDQAPSVLIKIQMKMSYIGKLGDCMTEYSKEHDCESACGLIFAFRKLMLIS